MATDQARLAVDTRAFPLLIYDPRKGDTISERLSLQGNPAVKDDWWTNPKTSEEVDFIDFARSEGRFAKHFDKDGNPSPTLLHAKQDRLENWHLLQELAGVLGGSKSAAKPAGAKAVAAPKPAAEKSAAAKAAAAKAGGNGSAAKAPESETTNGSAATGGADPEVKVDFKIGMKIKYHDGAVWVPGVVESIEPAVLALEDDTEIRTSLAVLEAGAAEGLIVGLV